MEVIYRSKFNNEIPITGLKNPSILYFDQDFLIQ